MRIIYLWQGERHVHLATPRTMAEANEIVQAMRAKGFRAWVETN